MLETCLKCGTRFAVGLLQCPHCQTLLGDDGGQEVAEIAQAPADSEPVPQPEVHSPPPSLQSYPVY